MIDVLRQIRVSGVTVLLVEHDMPSVMEGVRPACWCSTPAA